MLKPKKKITKKEIKQDSLVTAYAETTKFYYENKKLISYAVTALVIVVILALVYMNNRKQNNEKAATELGKVFTLYDNGASDHKQYKTAIDGQPERGIMGLKAIVDNYGSTQAGELARFYLASAYYQLGQFDDALPQFESFGNGSDFLKASALAGAGGCYEAKGQFDKAASAFEKAAGTISDPLNTPDYLSSAARCYGRAGNKSKAVSLYKLLKKEYPTSTYAHEADKFIAEYSV